MTTKRTTILAETDLLDRLDRHARRERTTKTAVIAAALEAYLAEHEPVGEPAFVAVCSSGHGRLSLDARRLASRLVGPGPRPALRPSAGTER